MCTSAQEKEIAIVAHRGYWNCDAAGSAKNSLASLKQAQELGVWGSEFDVNMSLDGELLVFHDGSVDGKRIENVTRWIIPVVSVVLYLATIGYAMNWNINIRQVAVIVVAGAFIATGSCIPKMTHIKNYKIAPEKARKINKFLGNGLVIIGVLFLISAFLPQIYTFICLGLLIPYTIAGIVYGIKVGR